MHNIVTSVGCDMNQFPPETYKLCTHQGLILDREHSRDNGCIVEMKD